MVRNKEGGRQYRNSLSSRIFVVERRWGLVLAKLEFCPSLCELARTKLSHNTVCLIKNPFAASIPVRIHISTCVTVTRRKSVLKL